METTPSTSSVNKEIYAEVGNTIDAFNSELNNGRGISAIRDVASALKRGHVESAKATIVGEWDKISTHKRVAEYLIAKGLFEPVDFNKHLGG
jgi:hypothetical protein